ASDGAVVGRAQAKFAPMGGGPLMAELLNAPLFAQLRYSGPADTLWRLTGSEVTDMVIDQLAADAHFSGPQLIFSKISGVTTGGGSITGNGSVTFSGGQA